MSFNGVFGLAARKTRNASTMNDIETNAASSQRSLSRFIAKTAGGTFVLRVFYLASGFITTLLLTRWIGAEGLGIYNFVISWVVLIAIFVKFGLEDYLVRETAAAHGRNDPETASRLWNFSRGFILAAALTVTGCIYCLLPWVAFENPELRPAFVVGVAMIPLLSLIAIYRGRFRANKQIVKSQVPEYLIRPILLMTTIGLLLWYATPGRPVIALLINVVATSIAVLFCLLSSRLKASDVEAIDPTSTPAKNTFPGYRKASTTWLLGAFPFVVISGIAIINQRTDRLMLGALQDMESVGLYSVAVQMAMVVNFTLIGINQAIAPLVAERHDANRGKELQKTLIQATNIATIGSLLIVAALVLLGPIVLAVFGPKFSASYLPMIILAVGQLLNVASGPAGTILSMSRHERFVGIGMSISVVCNILLNYMLIPSYGVSGAAIATALSVGIWNLLMVVFAKRHLGIDANAGAALIPNKIQAE